MATTLNNGVIWYIILLFLVTFGGRVDFTVPGRISLSGEEILRSNGQRAGIGSSSPGSSPGRGTALCFWARHFSLITTQVT